MVIRKKGSKKELGRFDWKNQVRLDAYDDTDSALTLTDKVFPGPFIVALNKSVSKESEWLGFMYLNTISHAGADQTEVVNPDEACNDEDGDDSEYHSLCIQGKDNFPNFNTYQDQDEIEE
jgi:hypothetical protein